MVPVLLTPTGLEAATSGTAVELATALVTTNNPGVSLYALGANQDIWFSQGIADTPVIASASANTLTAVGHQLVTGMAMQFAALGDTAISQAWQVAVAGPTFVDQTAAINNATANDVTPFATGIATNYFAVGYTSTFGALKVNVGTAGTVGTMVWEYWNGTAWTALSGVTDGTNGLTTGGTHSLTYTVPSDWAPSVLNASASLYYIRARCTGNFTVNPLITQAWFDGVLPAGISASTTYWAVVIDPNTFKIATTRANAVAAVPVIVDITTNGGGNNAMTVATAGAGSTFLPAGALILVDGSNGATVSVIQDSTGGKASITQIQAVR